MVTVRIDANEWYPCYSIDNSSCYETTISKKKFDNWKYVMAEFNRVQNEMEKVVCSENFNPRGTYLKNETN